MLRAKAQVCGEAGGAPISSTALVVPSLRDCGRSLAVSDAAGAQLQARPQLPSRAAHACAVASSHTARAARNCGRCGHPCGRQRAVKRTRCPNPHAPSDVVLRNRRARNHDRRRVLDLHLAQEHVAVLRSAHSQSAAASLQASLQRSRTLVSLMSPEPETSILMVPRGPRLLFITSCSPAAACTFMYNAALGPRLSAFWFKLRTLMARRRGGTHRGGRKGGSVAQECARARKIRSSRSGLKRPSEHCRRGPSWPPALLQPPCAACSWASSEWRLQGCPGACVLHRTP